MFGLGLPEILFILVVGAVILGPEHMPKTARLVGRWSAKMRSAATSFTQAVTEDPDLREVKGCLDETRSEISSVASELRRTGDEVRTTANQATSDVSDEVHGAYAAARQSLQKLQATTGRDVAPDFLHRPMGSLHASENLREIWLSAPKPVAPERQDSFIREHFTLPVPTDRCIAHALEPVRPGCAFCRIRHLPDPISAKNGDLRRFSL